MATDDRQATSSDKEAQQFCRTPEFIHGIGLKTDPVFDSQILDGACAGQLRLIHESLVLAL